MAHKSAQLASDVVIALQPVPATVGGAAGQRESAPFTLYQQQIWFREQLHPTRSLPNWVLLFRLKKPVLPELLKRALDEMMQRHPALRAAFKIEKCRLMQIIEPSLEVVLQESDLTADGNGEVRSLLLDEALRPFALAHPPLIRAKLVHCANDTILVITLHPIIIDRFSLDLFERQLKSCYERAQNQSSSDPGDACNRYADFAFSQPATAQNTGTGQQADLHIELPVDRPSALARAYAEASHEFVVPAEVANRLKAQGHDHQFTSCALLAAYCVLLARYSGRNDLVIGVAGARRVTPVPEDLMGCFEGLLPLELRVNPELPVGDWLRHVEQKLSEAYECIQPSFNEVGEPWNKTLNCFFSLIQADRAAGSPDAISADSEVTWRINALSKAPCDLAFGLVERFGEIRGICYFRADLFEKETIERMLCRYLGILEIMVSHPDLPVGQIEIALPEDSVVWDGPSEQPAAASSSMELGVLAAIRFMGLGRDSRLVLFDADGTDLHDFGKAAAAQSGAELVIAATEEQAAGCFPTHVLVSPATLAKIRKVFHVGQTTLVLYGLPCFSGVLARYQEFPFVGLWGLPQLSGCLASLKMERGEAVISAVANGFRLEVLESAGKQQVADLWGELHVAFKDERLPSGLSARYRSDGTIAVRGYKNRMADLNGATVDPEWLATLFRQHPAIADVAVAVQTQGDHKYLSVCIVPKTGRKVGEKELLRYVVDRLGFAYRPERLAIRQALPAAGVPLAVSDQLPRPPQSVVEAAIARTWREVLKYPQLDVRNSFFDQGSSLTAVEMVNRLRDALQVNINLPRLFESPTIADLAKSVESECMRGETKPGNLTGQ